jgi:hypothetical protein
MECEKGEMNMKYKPLKTEVEEVTGMAFALKAMWLPKGRGKSDSVMDVYDARIVYLGDNDRRLARKLVKAGPDHGKFARGIQVNVWLDFQIDWMIEMDTYRIGNDTLSTSSTMHMELAKLSGLELIENKLDLCATKVYRRAVRFSYQNLRAIYKARWNHKHNNWRIFCQFIESLPYFKHLIMPDLKEGRKVKLLVNPDEL